MSHPRKARVLYHLLRERGDWRRAAQMCRDLIATDTAVRPMLTAGVAPQFAVALDPCPALPR